MTKLAHLRDKLEFEYSRFYGFYGTEEQEEERDRCIKKLMKEIQLLEGYEPEPKAPEIVEPEEGWMIELDKSIERGILEMKKRGPYR